MTILAEGASGLIVRVAQAEKWLFELSVGGKSVAVFLGWIEK